MPITLVGLEDKKVGEGDTVEFEVQAQGGQTPYTYEWTKNGQPQASKDAKLTFKAAQSDNGAKVKVKVTDTANVSEEATATLTVEESEPASQDPLLLRDKAYERKAAKWLAVLLAVLVIPIAVLAFLLLTGTDRDFAGIVAVELIAVGAAMGVAAIYMSVIELAGRSYSFKQLQQKQGRADLAEVIKELPKVIESFGKLSGRAALALVAIVCFVAAAWIAVASVDSDSTDATSTTTTTTTVPG